MADRITLEQMLNLADRAESGPLSAGEAARLRAGIAQLHAERASLRSRIRAQTRRRNDAVAELQGVWHLVRRSQQGGHTQLPVRAVVAVLSDEPNREAA